MSMGDILFTGKSDEEHLRNLEEVLSHLEKAEICLKCSNVPSCSNQSNIWDIPFRRRVYSQLARRSKLSRVHQPQLT